MIQGRLTTNSVILEKHEMRTVVFFLERGFDIELIPKSNLCGVHSPDLRMSKREWEMKAPKGEGKWLIANTLHRAARQSENIIIDLRRIKIHQNRCLTELEKNFRDLKRLRRMKVITKTQELIDFIK